MINLVFSVGQQLVFGYNAPKFLSATVTAIEATDLRQVSQKSLHFTANLVVPR